MYVLHIVYVLSSDDYDDDGVHVVSQFIIFSSSTMNSPGIFQFAQMLQSLPYAK